jgi:hypothetical protein
MLIANATNGPDREQSREGTPIGVRGRGVFFNALDNQTIPVDAQRRSPELR